MKRPVTQTSSQKRLSILIFILALFLVPISAQYYWVGGSGNWSDYANHWATTSGGSTFHTSVPTANDDVYFDAASFTGTGQTVTIDVADASCLSMDWTGVQHYPGFVYDDLQVILNIHGSLTLSADMTCNLRFVEFESDLPGNTITTSGNSLGAISIIRFDGNGSWDLQDVFEGYFVQHTRGIVNTNNNTINVSQYSFLGDWEKELNAGSSIINAGTFRAGGTNTTLNMGTSTLVTGLFYADENGGGPYTYYNVEFQSGGAIYNSFEVNKLTLDNDGHSGNDYRIESGATITLNELEVIASQEAPLSLHSSVAGSEATISKASGDVLIQYVILQDIHAEGGATFTIENGVDNGNNLGWNITAVTSKDYFWVGDGGNWSDYENHWATSSGGSEFHTSPPTQFDSVYFDANSITEAYQTVEIDSPAFCAYIESSGSELGPNLYARYENPLEVYGSVNFSDATSGSIYNLSLKGEGSNNTIDMGGVSTSNMYLYDSGVWTLMSNLSSGSFGVYDDVDFDSNGYDMNIAFSFSQRGTGVSISLDSSVISARDFILRDEEISFDAGTSEIILSRQLDGLGFNFYKLTVDGDVLINDENTIEILEIVPGSSLTLEAGTAQQIIQSFTSNGTPGLPITLSSSVQGTQASLIKASGSVNGSWMILEDMNADGGAVFNATESVDNGNNTGWNIAGIVAQDFYWVGGSGTWSDYENHWATSSGGSTFRTREPGSLDNVYFDANSFTGEDQIVIIGAEAVTVNSMSWEGVTHNPLLSGSDKILNIYGSLTLSPNMEINVRTINFYGNEDESITAGRSSYPGKSTYMYFEGDGHYTLQDSITVRELHLNNGTLSTNDQWVYVDFSFYFGGYALKMLNLGRTELFTRSMQWYGMGDSLVVNGGESLIQFSSGFEVGSIGDYIHLTFDDLHVVHGNFNDYARMDYNVTVDTFLIEAGKNLQIRGTRTVTCNQMIAEGTADDPISISAVVPGTQYYISQASGTVEGYYLELQDINATGGATFNAYSSLDLGNVSGWTFFKESQTIDFDEIPDKLLDAEPFRIYATASSGLDVSFEILSGPATLSGDTVTLTGTYGEVQIQATQPGDEIYLPAPSVKHSFHVAAYEQSLTFDELPDMLSTDPPVTLVATASSGLDVSFAVLSGPATIDGDQLSLTGEAGAVEVEASQEGSDQYLPAEPIVRSFEVTLPISVSSNDAAQIKLWPNPTRDVLSISAPFALEAVSYEIMDINGKRLFTSQLINQQLSVSGLEKGYYILVIQSGQEIYRLPFVKMD